MERGGRGSEDEEWRVVEHRPGASGVAVAALQVDSSVSLPLVAAGDGVVVIVADGAIALPFSVAGTAAAVVLILVDSNVLLPLAVSGAGTVSDPLAEIVGTGDVALPFTVDGSGTVATPPAPKYGAKPWRFARVEPTPPPEPKRRRRHRRPAPVFHRWVPQRPLSIDQLLAELARPPKADQGVDHAIAGVDPSLELLLLTAAVVDLG